MSAVEFPFPLAAAGAPATVGGAVVPAVAGGADTPKRSRMLGVLLSEAPAGSGAAAKGLVAFCFSYKRIDFT